jgi:hypothetical protein
MAMANRGRKGGFVGMKAIFISVSEIFKNEKIDFKEDIHFKIKNYNKKCNKKYNFVCDLRKI